MRRIRIQPYNAGSRSARELSEASGVQRVRLVRTRFRPRPGDLIVNWGSGRSLFANEYYLNHPNAVNMASDKYDALCAMHDAGVSVPPFTTERETAQGWADAGDIVVVRSLLRSNSGRGVGLVGRDINDGDHTGVVPEAPLYTKYIPKYDEYRIHVFNGEVLDVQQKRRRNNEQADTRIRNAGNGWVFCRQNVNPPQVVVDEAILSVAALGLDFGAADVGYTRRSDRATVYEVNTAPGIEGTTLERYATAIRNL